MERSSGMAGSLRGQLEIAADPATAFDQFVEDLTAGLEQQQLTITAGPNGRIESDGVEIAHIAAWQPGECVRLAWAQADAAGAATEIEIRFRQVPAGTEVTVDATNWVGAIGPIGDISGWFASQIAAPLIAALSPAKVADWVTDRVARRPSGRRARANYGDPLYHYPSFQMILEELELQPDDVLLDVGCGGGAFVRMSLESGCRVAGVDHSLEMVRLAREQNRAAIAAGRAQIVQGSCDELPFEDSTFTCASMSGVLGFLLDPVKCFAEIRRVLRPGGRFVTLGSDSRLRGTPAAPEPIASRLRFYDDEQLESMGRAAGFDQTTIVRRDLSGPARAVGVPEEHLDLFRGLTAFLVAKKRHNTDGAKP